MNFLGVYAMVYLAAFVLSFFSHCFFLQATFMNDVFCLASNLCFCLMSSITLSVVF